MAICELELWKVDGRYTVCLRVGELIVPVNALTYETKKEAETEQRRLRRKFRDTGMEKRLAIAESIKRLLMR